jgi:nicotinamide-nucleotide amidase
MTRSDPAELAPSAESLAQQIGALAKARGQTVATAESLTGGKLACHLAAAPDSSEWFRGSVVAYSSQVKFDVLGVPVGPVIGQVCAAAMAEGVADLLHADLSVAVTGVGGPEDQEGKPPGTVWFGVSIGGSVHVELRYFDGDPEQVLEQTTLHALRLLLEQARVEGDSAGSERRRLP